MFSLLSNFALGHLPLTGKVACALKDVCGCAGPLLDSRLSSLLHTTSSSSFASSTPGPGF